MLDQQLALSPVTARRAQPPLIFSTGGSSANTCHSPAVGQFAEAGAFLVEFGYHKEQSSMSGTVRSMDELPVYNYAYSSAHPRYSGSISVFSGCHSTQESPQNRPARCGKSGDFQGIT